MAGTALIANALATGTMVGVVWFVQIVHYPLLARYGAAESPGVSAEHQTRTGFVVALPMAVEGVTTLVLLATRPAGVGAGAVRLAHGGAIAGAGGIWWGGIGHCASAQEARYTSLLCCFLT